MNPCGCLPDIGDLLLEISHERRNMPKRLIRVKENNEARYKDYLEELDNNALYINYREIGNFEPTESNQSSISDPFFEVFLFSPYLELSHILEIPY